MLRKIVWGALWAFWAYAVVGFIYTAIKWFDGSPGLTLIFFPELGAIVVAPVLIWVISRASKRRADAKLAKMSYLDQQQRAKRDGRFIVWALGLFFGGMFVLWLLSSLPQ